MRKKQGYLDEIYRKYVKALYLYLYKLCGSQQLAEDLVQETFVRATISLDTYNDDYARAWLFKVARNTYLDEWRKLERRKKHPIFQFFLKSSDMTSPYGVPETELAKDETRQQIKDLLHKLPENYRTILYLREYENFSYEEIASVLEVTTEQVKVTLYRARRRLTDIAEKKEWFEDGME